MSRSGLRTLLAALTHPPTPLTGAFNPYADYDPALDAPGAPRIRLLNLARYLRERRQAPIALIGEAAGYRGCRFTGIPFTCEAQLGESGNTRYRTTSLRGNYDERSARCLWRAIGARSDVIFWNAFPWHPHRPGQPLSNRRPSAAELRAGCFVLKLFLSWKQPERVIAVGRAAERALRTLGAPTIYVRHPSHGGRRGFESAIHSLL
ncbi:MAG: uracil-DNA glycosylase, partial [Anaerolineae bacterium]|nr:uracil-DNA glycosylase [Anaerolineae bacterium]